MDVAALRALFPALEGQLYFNFAGVAPTSTRVAAAARTFLDDLVQNGIRNEAGWERSAEATRGAAARIVGAKPGEIALVRNTSHGLGLVAEGLPWHEGDEVAVCTALEYPSNVYPWLHLADRGVKVREVAPRDGGVSVEAVAAACTPRTKLVAVSSAQYATGVPTDLPALGAWCRAHDVLLCVDGIQTVGCVPVDVKAAGVHFLAADSHKWMMGVPGVGFLFVDEAVLPRLRPVLVGWKSTTDAWNFDRAHFELRTDAAKLEEGSPSYALVAGMGAALELLLEVGVDAIAARVAGHVERLVTGLARLGCEVTPAHAPRVGIVTFVPREGSAKALHERLVAAGASVSLRRGRIRVSPSFLNTEEEIDRLLALVAENQ